MGSSPGVVDPDQVLRGRLRWHCRRGLKELDALLVRFVEGRLDHLEQADLQVLSRLLAAEDHQLLAWLLGEQAAPEPDFQRLLAIIRNA